MSTQMSVFLSQEAAQPQWGARAILSFSEAGATIHIGEGHDLGAVQRAGRTLDGQGIALVALSGERLGSRKCLGFLPRLPWTKEKECIGVGCSS